jgi:hypothetical protein
MESRRMLLPLAAVALVGLSVSTGVLAQSSVPASSSSSSSAKHVAKPAASSDSGINGSVTNGFYSNKTFAFTCKIPPGWVLRTDEMNARGEKKEEEKKAEDQKAGGQKADDQKTEDQKTEAQKDKDADRPPASSTGAKVLLAAFSRPPEAHGEDVNASIVIAAESAASYPGLKEAAQYFFPLNEVAKAQGFTADEDPYDAAVGGRTLVRGDFHKNVGTRVMHQSTLVMLSHGYAISITVIGGTDDEVEDLVDGLTFTGDKN